MGNFKNDLKKGKEWEDRVLEVLTENWIYAIKNPSEKEMDILFPQIWAEIKTDEYAQFSWNFYIEFECNWKPSWLFRHERLLLKDWIHTDKRRIFLLDANDLKGVVLEKIEDCRANKSNTSKGFRVVEQWWDWGRTKWLLIPIKEMEKLAYKIFNY